MLACWLSSSAGLKLEAQRDEAICPQSHSQIAAGRCEKPAPPVTSDSEWGLAPDHFIDWLHLPGHCCVLARHVTQSGGKPGLAKHVFKCSPNEVLTEAPGREFGAWSVPLW